MLTFVQDFLAEQRRKARIPRQGYLHASGFAVGSAKSRTPKRASQRARRRAEKLATKHEALHNPSGAKGLRRVAKTKTGLRMTYEEAVMWSKTGKVPERDV